MQFLIIHTYCKHYKKVVSNLEYVCRYCIHLYETDACIHEKIKTLTKQNVYYLLIIHMYIIYLCIISK